MKSLIQKIYAVLTDPEYRVDDWFLRYYNAFRITPDPKLGLESLDIGQLEEVYKEVKDLKIDPNANYEEAMNFINKRDIILKEINKKFIYLNFLLNFRTTIVKEKEEYYVLVKVKYFDLENKECGSKVIDKSFDDESVKEYVNFLKDRIRKLENDVWSLKRDMDNAETEEIVEEDE